MIKGNSAESNMLGLISWLSSTTCGTQGKWLHLSDPKLIHLNTEALQYNTYCILLLRGLKSTLQVLIEDLVLSLFFLFFTFTGFTVLC